MTRERFDFLVTRLEGYARAHPMRYRLRVALLAALGYTYLFLVVLLLLLAVGAVLWMGRINFIVTKLLWLPLVLVGAVGRALWVTFPAPEGHELRQEDAPRLFEMVGEVRGVLAAPRPAHILITDEFNAGIVQRPRLGIFGWQQNYLILGLPLMQALSPVQFRSVVAHEFGHLSGNHGRFGGWTYRVRQTWAQLLERLQTERRRGSFIFERFLNWYAPFFNAYSFVLARRQEYEADALAVEVAGREAAAEALVASEVKGKFLSESYWQNVFRAANHTASPPDAAFARMFVALQREATTDPQTPAWLRRSLLEQTSSSDTHPALADRLTALGYPTATDAELRDRLPNVFRPLDETAANHYLGDAAARLTDEMNRRWREQAQSAWRERHEYAGELRRQLDGLEAKRRAGSLDAEEMWARARAITELEGRETAEQALQDVLAVNSEHTAANFLLGQVLLARGDGAGVAHVERAMANDFQLVLPGCEALHGFYTQRGQTDEAARIDERGHKHYEMLEAATRERQTLDRNVRLEPHRLSAEQVENLRGQLRRFSVEVKTAYLARKTVAHLPEVPCYVLGVVPEKAWYQFRPSGASAELVSRLVAELELPGEAFVVALEGDYKHFRAAFARLDEAQIYPAGEFGK